MAVIVGEVNDQVLLVTPLIPGIKDEEQDIGDPIITQLQPIVTEPGLENDAVHKMALEQVEVVDSTLTTTVENTAPQRNKKTNQSTPLNEFT